MPCCNRKSCNCDYCLEKKERNRIRLREQYKKIKVDPVEYEKHKIKSRESMRKHRSEKKKTMLEIVEKIAKNP